MKAIIYLTLFLSYSVFAVDSNTENQPTESSQFLSLYVYTPIKAIDWTSPSTALKSSISNGLRSKRIKTFKEKVNLSLVGHMVVRYQCVDSDGVEYDEWTGITGQNQVKLDMENVFKKKWGLGVMIEEYIDGEILGTEYSRYEVANFYGRKERNDRGKRKRHKPSFMRFPISTKDCDELVRFHNTFKKISYVKGTPLKVQAQKNPEDILYFGFTIDPYESYLKHLERPGEVKLGGGCTAFGAAFLKLVGKFRPEFDQLWRVNLEVSERFFGGKFSTLGDDYEVSFLKLIGQLGDQWTYDGYDNINIGFYDTEKTWRFMVGVNECAAYRAGDINQKGPSCTDEILAWYDQNAHRVNAEVKTVVSAERVKYKTTKRFHHKSHAPGKRVKIEYDEDVTLRGIQIN